MSSAQENLFECIGGPLCGSKVEDFKEYGNFCYTDQDHRNHYYRLVRIETQDHSAGYTFFHYFGCNSRIARRAEPVFVPYKRLARAKRRK